MHTLHHIKQIGKRITGARKITIDALTALSKPATVQEIAVYLKKKRVKIDLVSIYRTLHLLSEMGVVHVFEFGEGKKRFELMNGQKHHHHFVCDNCKSVNEIFLSEEQILINELKRQTHFQIRRHTLEFFGLCPDCQ